MALASSFNPLLEENIQFVPAAIAQTVVVAQSGGDFTSIQGAIDSITDATALKPYLIKVEAGTYAPITLKPYVHIIATLGTVVVLGTDATAVTANFTGTDYANLQGITFVNYSASDDSHVAETVGDVNFDLCSFYLIPTGDFSGVAVKTSAATLQIMGRCTIAVEPTVATTKWLDGIRCNGAGTMSIYLSSVLVNINAASGDTCCIDENGTGERNYNNLLLRYFNADAGFSGTAKGFCVSSVSTGQRLSQASQIRLVGSGGGTAYAFSLDSTTNDATYFHTNSVVVVDGFGTEGVAFTGTGDVQRVWLSSPTKDLHKYGTGLSVVTPLDKEETGFVEWGPEATYWSYDTGTALFTVEKSGAGCVHGAPMAWAAGQSVAIADRAVNYVYMDSTGTIGVQTSPAGIYNENVVLFEVWRQGTNYIVSKENHPFKFTSAISEAWHNLFGSLLQNATQTLAVNSAANRTVNLVGSNVLTDHGLDSTIEAQTPMTLVQMVEGVSGAMAQVASSSSILSVKSNGTDTGVNVANNQFIVYRIGVVKESLNSATPTFISICDDTDSGNLSGANTRITGGLVRPFPVEARRLEICQLGFAIVKANGAGAGTLEQVTTALQVFGAQFVSGGTSTSGSLITLDSTNFDKNLAPTDTNVQLFATAFDEFNALPSNATNASASPDLTNKSAFASATDGQSATFTFDARGVIEFQVDVGTDGGMLISCDYKSTGINALSDPSNLFLETDAGTGIVVTKSANSAAVTVKNRTGTTETIGILAVRSPITAATAWS
jgi:hypothetical protein